MAEFTIVGAGLAGTALAWALHRRGRTFRLIDREPPTTASRVAAGLLTPITGKKPALSWRWHELRPAAERFYREVEATTGRTFFHHRPVVRAFTSRQEQEAFRNPAFSGLVLTADEVLMPSAAQLDTNAYLDASRDFFRTLGMCERAEWGGKVKGTTVVCQGYTPDSSFALPFRPAKGEVLTVRAPDTPDDRVYNRRGMWLAPTGQSGEFRFGATYSWDRLNAEPTAEGRDELERKLGELARGSTKVIAHTAGVRPIVAGQKPVIGTHPTIPHLAVFNGLSSKGALTAPFFADMLAAHLCDGTPIDPEVEVRVRMNHP